MTDEGLRSTLERGRLADAIRAFLDRKAAYGGTLHSDGTRLYSYGLTCIAEWRDETIVLMESDKYYSRTTNRHRHMLEAMATAKGIEVTKE